VAHPDLVPIAREIFDARLGSREHQKNELREEGFAITARDLLPAPIEGGKITEAGVNANISVALAYISAWLRGQGAVAIHNLMEDAATAEISRAQLWQWVRREVILVEGSRLSRAEFRRRLEAERARFAGHAERDRLSDACDLLESLVLS